MTLTGLAAGLAKSLFTPREPGVEPGRVGAEVELLSVDAATGRIAPLGDGAPGSRSTLGVVRRHGTARGWIEEPVGQGVSRFRLPEGGVITFEPGGQVEYSAPPSPTATGLLHDLRAVIEPLRQSAREEGLELLTTGIDPVNPPAAAPLQIRSERYCRMAEYFAVLGPAGARMMRQTAALQISLDLGNEPFERWRFVNRLTPYLVAIFANSPVYAGRATGHQSYRAATWRTLDSSRTGAFFEEGAPVAAYLEFALAAPDLMRPLRGGRYLSFCGWLTRGDASSTDWETHLSTLFPEVRPRGYLEVRSLDAIPPEWYPAPVAFLSGLLYHRPSRLAAAELVSSSNAALLVEAGVRGVADPAIARTAGELFDLALAGCAALGPQFIDPAEVDVARDFAEQYTRRGRTLADEVLGPRC